MTSVIKFTNIENPATVQLSYTVNTPEALTK